MTLLDPDDDGSGPAVDQPWAWHFSPAQMNDLLGLGTEDRQTVIAGLPVDARLSAVRELQDMARRTHDEQAFEEQVELNRERKRARQEADRRDNEEREAHLTSSDGRAEAAERIRAKFIDLDDLEDPEPLIDGFLYRESMVRTFGPPKSLKSFVTLDMAASVSLGIPWQGNPTVQTKVLYVVAEGLRGVKKRRNAWNEYHETEMKVMFYPEAIQLNEQDAMHDLISFCIAEDIGYVIFDTQARCTVGIDENDNTLMGEVVHSLDILKRETGACVHLVHHSVGSNDAKARGATAWDGAVDAEFYTKRDRDNDTVEFVTKFQKDVQEAGKVYLVAREVGASLVLCSDGGHQGAAQEVTAALVSDANAVYLETICTFGGPASRTDIVNDLKDQGKPRSATAVKKAVNQLLASGALEQVGTGTNVRITQAGLVYLDGWRKTMINRAENQGAIPGVIDTSMTPTNDTQ